MMEDILKTPPKTKETNTEKRKNTGHEEMVNLAKKIKQACIECDKAFSRKSNLNRYMKKFQEA